MYGNESLILIFINEIRLSFETKENHGISDKNVLFRVSMDLNVFNYQFEIIEFCDNSSSILMILFLSICMPILLSKEKLRLDIFKWYPDFIYGRKAPK